MERIMNVYQDTIGRARIIAAQVIVPLAIGAAALLGGALTARAHDTGPEHPVFSGELPNVPGKALTAVLVTYAPGQKSPVHHHAGSVFAYVVSGAIRSENSATGAVKVYQAGEAFFEPPGSTHLVSENASTTEPASLLAVFVADDGAKLTTPGK
jgi:quercetin dioxygenase-like cupin family protein